jgi:hypothetical protein
VLIRGQVCVGGMVVNSSTLADLALYVTRRYLLVLRCTSGAQSRSLDQLLYTMDNACRLSGLAWVRFGPLFPCDLTTGCLVTGIRSVDVTGDSVLRLDVIQYPQLCSGGNALTFTLPAPGPHAAGTEGDASSVMSDHASVASFLSTSAGPPALYHLGQGVFRQRNVLRDGEHDAELFSVETFLNVTVPLGVTLAMRTIDVPCDSSSTAVRLKQWLQQYVDDAQPATHGQAGPGKRLGPLGLPIRKV